MKRGELTFGFMGLHYMSNTTPPTTDTYITFDGYDFGIAMGDGFVDAFNAPFQTKDMIVNESRVEHGARVLVNTNVSPRTLNLKFHIHGTAGYPPPFENVYYIGQTYFKRLNFFKTFFSLVGANARYDTIEEYEGESRLYRNIKQKPFIDIAIQGIGKRRFVYTGKSATYNHSYNGQFGIIQAQFYEPNPMGYIDNSGISHNTFIDTI